MATDPRVEPELPPLPRVIKVATNSLFPFCFGVIGYLAGRDDTLAGLPMLALAVLSFSAMLSALLLFLLDPDARTAYAERRAIRMVRARDVAARDAVRAADWARAVAVRNAARAADIEVRGKAEELRITYEADAASAVRSAPKERRKLSPKCIKTKVVGVTFRNDDGSDRQRLIARYCRAGKSLAIRRDLDNRHDEYAVAVFADRHQIGHLRSGLAEEVVDWLEAGMTARVTILQVTGGGRGESLGVNIQIDMT